MVINKNDGSKTTIQISDIKSITFEEAGTITDTRDGKVYKTAKIGLNTWMTENLAYLPSVNVMNAGSETSAYYYVYGYNGTDVNAAKSNPNYSKYGVLYNWPAAMAGALSSDKVPSAVRGVCPAGWHLPSNAEWKQLEMALGMSSSVVDVPGWRGTDQGVQMKSTTLWNSNGNGTNSSGFNGLPGGYHDNLGNFDNAGYYGSWWTSTESGSSLAWGRYLSYDKNNVNLVSYFKSGGFSVRCVKD
jgi:uncharacterized protein (TIGR02145 family)